MSKLPGGAKPAELLLQQNYPNPFSPATGLRFLLPDARRVTLKVYEVPAER